MTASAAVLTIAIPAFAAVLGLLVGRRWGADTRYLGVAGAFGALAGACLELWAVLTDGPRERIPFLGLVDTGVGVLHLDLRADQLSAFVAVAVGLVAFCVQVYSTAYLHGPGTPDAPTRYPAYAATVSLFTAAMMLVVHADDLVLLLVGWEVMGLCSYLLVGHHSERDSARRAAVKAFLVTRVGDLGLLLAVVVLVVAAGTTSISALTSGTVQLSRGTWLAVALLVLAAAAGKSAQFPLHTWLPDAMEGPTPVSALIHAATMVAAGVFLVARLLPVFLASDGGLAVAAVVASITMLGAALAALAQDDLKRLLAWSTVSQVAYMLAGVSVSAATDGEGVAGAQAGIFHLLSHAAFKALLFLVAGCVTHVVGSTLLADMGGLRRTHAPLALLLGLGLAGLAGLPPLGGFWSKEAVLTAAEHAASSGVGWPAQMVLASGLVTTLVTGVYAGRAFAIVATGDVRPAPGAVGAAAADPALVPAAQEGEPPADAVADAAVDADAAVTEDSHAPAAHALPRAMVWPLWVLAVPTVLLGLVLVRPPALVGEVHVEVWTAFTGTLLSLAGIGWALTAPALGARDVADALPRAVRAALRDGYRIDALQDLLVVRPVRALARAVGRGDRDVVDAYVRGTATGAGWAGLVLRRAQSGLVTGYLSWVLAGAAVLAAVGVVLS
ncbi:NADH-quinone oxidoreductase subunit L [Kineosporia sp. R_H_3]|uniref:NADH-quinone oxidoreductase subunit 5 family protein n=1 Tax=Kineosporia sp. R_H_3 TaxID=1961848 RepID=UPI000B4BE9B6|nr:NADH-quinone oxidoreductase subunit L [Kineosporia sp. R_H_3]